MVRQDEKRILGFSKEQIIRFICPWMLAVAVFFASIYTFHNASAYLLTPIFAFLSALLFKLFDKLKVEKGGTLKYILIMLLVFAISFALLVFQMVIFGYYSPMRWFYAQANISNFQPLLIGALAIGGGFFLISVIYYFTMIRYRTLGVMLCTMFPYFFFAKRYDIMPDILTTIIMLLTLAVIIHNKRISDAGKDKSKAKVQVDKAYIICISVFILITGTLTMAANKPVYESFLERNSTLFDPFNMNLEGLTGYEELSNKSSSRNAQPEYNYRPLFYMKTDSDSEEIFLRTKSYNYFNGDVWEVTDMGRFYYYSQQIPEYSTDDLARDISVLEKSENKGLYKICIAHVYDDDFSPMYLPAPYGVVTDKQAATDLTYHKLCTDTSVLRTMTFYNAKKLDDEYTFIEATDKLENIAEKLNFSSEEYISYLESSESDNAKALKKAYDEARADYLDQSNISDKLKNLAKEITSDCHSDLEKARKLESYFSEKGYEYSLEYLPADISIDYFVFNSKTGYCANYATAMALMARSVGLPARYVEGFTAFERDSSGQIIIRDSYAHAFVEVYIPAAGWMTFNPTVAGYQEIPDNIQNGPNYELLSRLISLFSRISVVVVIAVGLIVLSFADRIKEIFVRFILIFKSVNEKIIYLYANMIRVLGKSVGKDFRSYTPDMLREYMKTNRGVVPERLISLFEKTAFGAYQCSKSEYQKAYSEYVRIYKYIRKQKKKES